MRLVQKMPLAARGLVIGFLIGAQCDPDLRKALPNWGIVMSEQSPTTVTSADLQSYRKLAGCDSDTPLVLVGFSAGCQSERAIINANLTRSVVGIAVFDGTAGQTPAPLPWQILCWAELAERARANAFRAVMTCTLMTYTKSIPPGQPNSGWPTRYILETAIGERLEVGEPVIDGGLYAEAFQSSDCDKEAHIRQQREVMPSLLSKCFGPDSPELAPPAPPSDWAPWKDPTIPQARRVALWILNEAKHGYHETPNGSNDGERIEFYFALDYKRRATGEKIGITHGEWCAALRCKADSECAIEGDTVPSPRVSGIELLEDAKADGTFFEFKDEKPEQGDIAVFDRPAAGTGWAKHVTTVLHTRDKCLLTVAGNEDNTLHVTAHTTEGKEAPEGYIRVGRSATPKEETPAATAE